MQAILLSLCFALLCNCCHAQEITVRVIKSDGRGLPNERVTVQFLYDDLSRSSALVQIKTNATGEARFHLPQPVPDRLDVLLILTSKTWRCDCWLVTNIAKVIEKGVVQMPSFMPKPTPKVPPKSSEIVFLARPPTRFFEDSLTVDPGNAAKALNPAARLPKPGAYITEYCIAQPTYPAQETGPVHVTYSDGSHFTLPRYPDQKGFTYPQLAEDRQTLGFLQTYDVDPNRPVPLAVAVFRSGLVTHRIGADATIWDWMFFQRNRFLVVSVGPLHFRAFPYGYELFDVETGHLVAEVPSGSDSEPDSELGPDAPQWAKRLEEKMAKWIPEDPRCKE